jgi:hypothetical protein
MWAEEEMMVMACRLIWLVLIHAMRVSASSRVLLVLPGRMKMLESGMPSCVSVCAERAVLLGMVMPYFSSSSLLDWLLLAIMMVSVRPAL